MAERVHVLGGAQTDFARNWSKDCEDPLSGMMEAAIDGAMADAGIDASDVQTAHVGNFAADSFANQAHLGALVNMLDPAWWALPTSRHEAACASGSIALLAASAEIQAGRYDVALVIGVELMRNVPGTEAARRLESATWTKGESFPDSLPWPSIFARIADETDRRHGLDHVHLNRIAEINRENARSNPLAQTRDWTWDPAEFADDDESNPVVVSPLRKTDCGRITDGACAVVLASDRYFEKWAARWADGAPRPSSVVAGWGHATAPLPLEQKFELSAENDLLFPHQRHAIIDAYRRAGIAGSAGIDVIETHDCFTINEYVAIEHFGLTRPGRAWEAIEDDRISKHGSLPINPSGGLIGAGHPVGATGVRMLLDAHRQVTGKAGACQIEGAETAMTLNVGGSCSTVASFIVQRPPA